MNRTLGIASRLGVCLLLVGATLAFGQANGDSPRPNVGKTPERIKVGGIENTFRLSPRLYSGGDPRGAEAFQALKALGIKTIVSVDGTVLPTTRVTLTKDKPVAFSVKTKSGLTAFAAGDNCTVAGGKITALKAEGTCTVRITTTGGKFYRPLVQTRTFALA